MAGGDAGSLASVCLLPGIFRRGGRGSHAPGKTDGIPGQKINARSSGADRDRICGVLPESGRPIPAPGEAYASLAPVKGFLYGYQTMDTLAALNFGMIIAMNIRAKGIRQEKAVMRETVNAGWIAGIFLLAVYGMLTFVGMRGGSAFSDASDGTGILSGMVGFLFGKGGMVILAVIFVIACFNTCVGLFSCCGKYFSGVFPGLSYSRWVLIFAFVSMVISNVGLEAILNFSQPALNAIYPLSILLIFLSCTHRWLGRFRAVYPWSAALCGIVSVLTVLDQQGIMLPGAAALLHRIPAYAAGFGWLLPSVLGICIGMAVSQVKIKAGVGHNHIGNDPEQSQSPWTAHPAGAFR